MWNLPEREPSEEMRGGEKGPTKESQENHCEAVQNVLLKISRYGFDVIYFTLLNFILLKTLFIKIAAAFCKNAAAKCLSCYQFLIRILTQNLILNEEILILDTGNISLLFQIFFCTLICRRKILFPVATEFFLILL